MWWETLVYFASGGLDEALYNVIAMAREQEIPFVFALGRKALGRCVNKLVPVSVVGIFNYSGAEVRQCHPRKRSLRAVPHLTFFYIYKITLSLSESLQPTGVSYWRSQEGLQRHGVSPGAGADWGSPEKWKEGPTPNGSLSEPFCCLCCFFLLHFLRTYLRGQWKRVR